MLSAGTWCSRVSCAGGGGRDYATEWTHPRAQEDLAASLRQVLGNSPAEALGKKERETEECRVAECGPVPVSRPQRRMQKNACLVVSHAGDEGALAWTGRCTHVRVRVSKRTGGLLDRCAPKVWPAHSACGSRANGPVAKHRGAPPSPPRLQRQVADSWEQQRGEAGCASASSAVARSRAGAWAILEARHAPRRSIGSVRLDDAAACTLTLFRRRDSWPRARSATGAGAKQATEASPPARRGATGAARALGRWPDAAARNKTVRVLWTVCMAATEGPKCSLLRPSLGPFRLLYSTPVPCIVHACVRDSKLQPAQAWR